MCVCVYIYIYIFFFYTGLGRVTFSRAKYGAGGAVRGSCFIWCNYHHHSIPSQDLCLLMITSREILVCSDKSLVHTAVQWRNRFSKKIYFAIHLFILMVFYLFSEELKRRMSNSFSCNKNGCTAKLQKGPKNTIKLVGTTRDFELILAENLEFKGLFTLSIFSFFRIRHPSKCLLRMWKCRKSNLIRIFFMTDECFGGSV